MNNQSIQLVSCALIASTLSCSPRPDPKVDVMSIGWCDTTPIKPFGLPVAIPPVSTKAGVGAIAGSVVQLETGDAMRDATVNLTVIDETKSQSQPWGLTDAKGGFAFDSLAPGRYQAKARRLGSFMDTLTVHVTANEVDTVRFRLPTNRCYGY